jgi:prepilin-type N-terminal cleavage/methylation domain-containing protein
MNSDRLLIRTGHHGFTLVEVLLALAVFAMAVVGLAKALDTALESGLEVRQRSTLRAELESQLAYRMAFPLGQEKLILEAKDNHGIRIEETLTPYPLKNQQGNEIQNVKKLTILAVMGSESDSASILVNSP